MTLMKRKARSLGLLLIIFLVLLEILILSPSSIEDQIEMITMIDPETLIPQVTQHLVGSIPKNKIPDNSVQGFTFLSAQGLEKLWKLEAKRAFFYQSDKLVHSLSVVAYLFDPEEKITTVTGDEARYLTNQKDLEVFGNVVATLPDGFTLRSPYLRYLPALKTIQIPETYRIRGYGEGKPDEASIEFESNGLSYPMQKNEISLLAKVVFISKGKGENPSPPKTTIESDRCVIFRDKQLAHFFMNLKTFKGGSEKNFVLIKQPTLLAKSRKAKLHYGDFSKLLKYLIANDEVFIKETGNSTNLRYATGGQAEFDAKQNTVILSEYPQAYQDNDTVVGDIIVFHRDSDILEVENSNAFSEGSEVKN